MARRENNRTAGGRVAGDEEPNEWLLDSVAYTVEKHRDYIDEREEGTIVAENEETGEAIAMPWKHRWTNSYQSRTRQKVEQAVKGLREQGWSVGGLPVTMVTLTADQRGKYGKQRPMIEVLRDLKAGWDKFRDVVRRRTEGFRNEVMTVIGPHESGYPHLHVLIFGSCLPSLADDVRRLWVEKYGIGRHEAHEKAVSAVRSAPADDAAGYVMKNIREAEWEWDEEEAGVDDISGYQAFCAMMWVSGSKRITMSQGLADAIAVGAESSGEWTFVGTAYGVEPGVYGGEAAEAIIEAARKGTEAKPPP